MKKQTTLIFILLATIVCTTSYASENLSLKDKIYKLKEVDTPPRVIRFVQPSRPRNENNFMYTGWVILRFIVTKKGFVKEPEVIESVPAGVFDKSALTAIKQSRFKPAIKNGVPVDCLAKMPIEYSTEGDEYKFGLYKTSIGTYLTSDRGLKYLKNGEYHKAIRAFNKALNLNSQFIPCYYGRGIAYMNLGKYEKAVSDFSEAIKLAPENGTYYKLRGQAYSELKEYKKGIDDYSKALDKKPHMIEAYFDRGEAFRESGKYKKAIDDYTRAIRLNKKYVQAYNDRAVSYNKLKDTKDMCLDLKKACELGDCRGFNYAKKAGKCTGDLASAKLK